MLVPQRRDMKPAAPLFCAARHAAKVTAFYLILLCKVQEKGPKKERKWLLEQVQQGVRSLNSMGGGGGSSSS